jgi:hypothetical protein
VIEADVCHLDSFVENEELALEKIDTVIGTTGEEICRALAT